MIEELTSTRFKSITSALMKTVICKMAFNKTLPAAYNAKFRTAGIGTRAPRANATVSVIVLNKMDGPILASVLATRSSAGKYNGSDRASTDSSREESNGERWDCVGGVCTWNPIPCDEMAALGP